MVLIRPLHSQDPRVKHSRAFLMSGAISVLRLF